MDVIFRDAKTFHWISGRLGRGSGKGFRSPEDHEHIPIRLYGACMSCERVRWKGCPYTTNVHSSVVSISRGCLIVADVLLIAITLHSTARGSVFSQLADARSLHSIMLRDGMSLICMLGSCALADPHVLQELCTSCT